jgi:hypothetical protein
MGDSSPERAADESNPGPIAGEDLREAMLGRDVDFRPDSSVLKRLLVEWDGAFSCSAGSPRLRAGACFKTRARPPLLPGSSQINISF